MYTVIENKFNWEKSPSVRLTLAACMGMHTTISFSASGIWDSATFLQSWEICSTHHVLKGISFPSFKYKPLNHQLTLAPFSWHSNAALRVTLVWSLMSQPLPQWFLILVVFLSYLGSFKLLMNASPTEKVCSPFWATGVIKALLMIPAYSQDGEYLLYCPVVSKYIYFRPAGSFHDFALGLLRWANLSLMGVFSPNPTLDLTGESLSADAWIVLLLMQVAPRNMEFLNSLFIIYFCHGEQKMPLIFQFFLLCLSFQ